MKDAKTNISSIRQKTHDGVDNVMDKAESIRQRSKQDMDRFKEKATEMRENMDEYIKTNPERSVLIATGLGVALGAMFTALLMRKK